MFKLCFGKKYYKNNDLQTGGWCGCCGKWLPNAVLLKYWEWDLCDKCIMRR